MARGLRNGFVKAFLVPSLKFHGVNALQLLSTGNILTTEELANAGHLWRTPEGTSLLKEFEVSQAGTRLEQFTRGMGPEERMNQEVIWLGTFNKAMSYGVTTKQAADFAFMRGNKDSQFLGLLTDVPILFRKMDPHGLLTLFQRFTVKQIEQLYDLARDHNFTGLGKSIAMLGLLGGWKALTFGSGVGWLTYKAYKEIEKEHGTDIANAFHVGLPAFLGVDVSNSILVINPPFGKSFAERLGNQLMGPIATTAYSGIGAALATKAVEPEAAKRAMDAYIRRIPLAHELDGVRRLIIGDYDMKDPLGRLRYRGDVKDALKMIAGARPVKESQLDLIANGEADLNAKRDEILDYAASRLGQATLAGVDLPKPLLDAIRKDVEAWNAIFGDVGPISGNEIFERAKRRREAAMLTLEERLIKQAPRAIRKNFMPQPKPGPMFPEPGQEYPVDYGGELP
jgi:hypothetical protein